MNLYVINNQIQWWGELSLGGNVFGGKRPFNFWGGMALGGNVLLPTGQGLEISEIGVGKGNKREEGVG